MQGGKELSVAYTPDSDDAFYYFGMETGKIQLHSWRPRFERRPMSILNRAALRGLHHVTAISSVIYPLIADCYAILSVGTSVGRGYGPVLVSKQRQDLDRLRGCRVGVGGIPTTGWFLLRCLYPEAIPVEMPFDRIAAAVAGGDLDAGVMIHEELLYYPEMGLQRVADLGAEWCRHNGLPLPVGLNVIRRDLGEHVMEQVCRTIRRSFRFGLRHRQEALTWVSQFGRGVEAKCTSRFVEMFANEDSLLIPGDVRRALTVLFQQVVDDGLGDDIPALDIIEGLSPARRRLTAKQP